MKFKIGDKVKINNDPMLELKYIGKIGVIVFEDSIQTYRVTFFDNLEEDWFNDFELTKYNPIKLPEYLRETND